MLVSLVWILSVIRHSSTRGLELQNGAAAIVLGVVLILPPDTFSPDRGYWLFERAPESWWGLMLMLAGTGQVAATLHGCPLGRRLAASILGVLFAVIALGVLTTVPYAAVTPLLLTLALGQFGAFWRARWGG